MALTINATWQANGLMLPITHDIGASLNETNYVTDAPRFGFGEIYVDMTNPPSPTDTFTIFGIDFNVTNANSVNTVALGVNLDEFAQNIATMLNMNYSVANKFIYDIPFNTLISSLQGNIVFEWIYLFEPIGLFGSQDNTSFMQIVGGDTGGNSVETENIVFSYNLLAENIDFHVYSTQIQHFVYFYKVGTTQQHIPILKQPQFNAIQPITIYFNNELEQIVSTTKPFDVTTIRIDRLFSRRFKIQGGKALRQIASVTLLEAVTTFEGRVMNMKLQRNELIADYDIEATNSAKFLTSRPRKQYYITYVYLLFSALTSSIESRNNALIASLLYLFVK